MLVLQLGNTRFAPRFHPAPERIAVIPQAPQIRYSKLILSIHRGLEVQSRVVFTIFQTRLPSQVQSRFL